MPGTSKLPLSPPPPSTETLGPTGGAHSPRARFTQVDLAKEAGLVQTLISEYEPGKLRLNAEMMFRFADALKRQHSNHKHGKLLKSMVRPMILGSPANRVCQNA